MDISDLKNKKIGIFGFGTEGQALLKYFAKHSLGEIRVFDEGKLDSGRVGLITKAGAKLVSGSFTKEGSKDIEVAFRSPGLNPDKIKSVVGANCEISSQTNLFFSLHRGKIIAVTGTKGKSTTVGLVDRVLSLANIKHFVGGNIGNAPIDFVDETTSDSFSLLELSSFQLEDLKTAPDIAIVLPLYIDHLDYHSSQGASANFHKTEDDYYQAKSKIASNMTSDNLLIAYCDQNVKKIADQCKAKKLFFCDRKSENDCSIDGNDLICKLDQEQEYYVDIVSFCQKAKIPLVNAIAALSFAFSQNITVSLGDLFNDFKKLPFRIQLVEQPGDLKFFNDSASTNPVSTIEAMKTMSEKYILIMGGSSKNLSYSDFATNAANDSNLTKVYLIGETADEIEGELRKANFRNEIIRKSNLRDVLSEIKGNHVSFDAVLFSPASASFDFYKNYKKRGEHFNELVTEFFK